MPSEKYPEISLRADGYWHAWVSVGTKPNGRTDQRHVKRKTKKATKERVDELLAQVREAAVVRPGRGMTVEQWLTIYLDTVAPRRCDPGTVKDYRSKCRLYVFPQIGKLRLDRLEPDHLDEVYLAMERQGLAGSTQLKTHRVLTRALKVALRRKLVPRNVAHLVDAPSLRPVEQRPLTADEAARVLQAAWDGRNGSRWAVGLALGLRQGEALGLRWQYLDLDAGVMNVWWQLRRRAFDHGCDPGAPCGRRRGGNCPDRRLTLRSGEIHLEGGLILKEPKGTGKRTIPIPRQLVALLRRHLAGQTIERTLAGSDWVDHDLVFTSIKGRPIDPSDDHKRWTQICKQAQVDDARLHDGRHTAGTMMLVLGADIATVQEVLGHADVRTTRGYVHVASEMTRAATSRLGTALFGEEIHPKAHP
jgi:integrase